MKDLERMFDRAVEIINECIDGVEIYPVNRPITINTRAKTRWGRCSRNGYTDVCTIEISSRILSDDVPDNATMGTIIHEILHACKGCHGHQGQWKRYANAVNSKYPQFNIQRTSGAETFGLAKEQDAFRKKYAIRCEGCGNTHYSSKMSKTIQHPERYRCRKCGGSLKRIDIRDIKVAVAAPAPMASMQLSFMDI